MKLGFVYLFRIHGMLKVGFTTDPDRRISEYQRMNGYRQLEVLGLVPGTSNDEKQILRTLHYWPTRSIGPFREWFDDSQDVINVWFMETAMSEDKRANPVMAIEV